MKSLYLHNIPVAVMVDTPSPIVVAVETWRRLLMAVKEAVMPRRSRADELQQRFDALLTTHGSLISRICFSYATDGDDFQDLRQDVLINIWKGLESFRGDSSSVTWIYRVALNTCVSTVRKRSTRPSTERLDSLPIDFTDDGGDDLLKERFDTLHRLISALSPIDKAIVTMWLDERSYDEIAYVVGVTRNNVGLRLHRIKEKWRKEVRN